VQPQFIDIARRQVLIDREQGPGAVQFALLVHPVVGSMAVQVDLGGYVDLAEMLDELSVLGADRGFDRVGGGAAVIQRSGLSVARRYEQRNALELGSQVVGVVLHSITSSLH
jgi:hypothetical protein